MQARMRRRAELVGISCSRSTHSMVAYCQPHITTDCPEVPDRVLEAHDLEGGVYKEIEASRLVARSSKSIRKRVFDLRRKTKNKN